MASYGSKQLVVDENGKQIGVILDLATYRKFLEALEELEDIQVYDEAKNRVREEIQAGECERHGDSTETGDQ